MSGGGASRLPRPLLLLLLLLLPACAGLTRLPAPPAEATLVLPMAGVANARFWLDGPLEPALEALRAANLRRGPRAEAHFLALSGGGDDGAFGAGLLIGWTERGDRPEFDVVTGISAGALIAPFAFLGPAYDPQLTEVFTAVAPADILDFRLLRLPFAILFGEALADTSPLYNLIARHADQRMLDAIAREHARGRMLLIGTTNLDLQRPVVWDIGAIAASGHPQSLELFRDILLASASIPGAFPPVMIEAEHRGQRFQEMHVDGGASMQVFLYPPSFVPRGPRAPDRTVHVVRNGRLRLEPETTPLGLFSIARRSASTLLHFSGVADIDRIRLLAERDGTGFRLAHIGDGFQAERPRAFDTAYMRALFAHGREVGRTGEGWIEAPVAPPRATPRPERNARQIPAGPRRSMLAPQSLQGGLPG